MQTRRNFLRNMALAAPVLSLSTACKTAAQHASKTKFEISLAEWSLHKALFAKKMTNLDFPVMAKKDFGISIVEYVNQFFADKAKDTTYLRELLMRCQDNGVSNHLIMIDGEGTMGDPDEAKRKQAVENHYKWVEAARFLGCKTIRVNAGGEGSKEEVAKRCTESLRQLCEFSKPLNINIIVENHGGNSSNGAWLSGVIKAVGMNNCGTLPDFGNFCIRRKDGPWTGPCVEEYDRYQGTAELMPYAKGVSAKAFEFDAAGNETTIDFARMFDIIRASGFNGIIGIEFEGEKLDEAEGIRKTLALLQRLNG